MERTLWTNYEMKITVGTLVAWCFFTLDFYSDVMYYLTVPKSNEFLRYLMLLSHILPPILNFLMITYNY